MDTRSATVARFHRRGASANEDPRHDKVRAIVAANGGDQVLAQCHAALERLILERPATVVIASAEGALEETYRSFVDSLN